MADCDLSVMKKRIYIFGDKNTEGSIEMKNILGGKGANLAEMCRLDLPIPPGFTISTEVCSEYYQNNCVLPSYLKKAIKSAVSVLEKKMNRVFGDARNPLFLSVRSGSRSSMPGMMDTILNLGMNDVTVLGMKNKRCAYDSYRRFIQMYGSVVHGVDTGVFEEIIDSVKCKHDIIEDVELTTEHLLLIVNQFTKTIELMCDKYTQDVHDHLHSAVKAVFDSWMSNRAISYRKINNIPEEWGTAVNIQVMVFGNMNLNSGSGVAFTRNPSTGDKELFGEYLVNAQGEDVVSGLRTPKVIVGNMNNELPDAYEDLLKIGGRLEEHYRDMQDIEFTVQDKKLWLLQTRCAKRTAKSAIKVAMDMINDGLITKEEAVMRIDPYSLEQLIHPVLDETIDCKVIAQGLPAAPGAISGVVVFSTDDAVAEVKNGADVILVRRETSPEDIDGMHTAVGILTTCGGMTSHAAVVSRGMGKVCVCGADGIAIDYEHNMFITKDNIVVKKGDIITLDGSSGKVIFGKAVTRNSMLFDQFYDFMDIMREVAPQVRVRANADNVQDIRSAKLFGTDGVGLCRTEHMFFSSERINLVRRMIIAETSSDRISVLNKLEKIQTQDFIEIFKEIGGLPVTIRLLDPPLHEFLPHDEKSIRLLADSMNIPYSQLSQRIVRLKETNPMLGHRGCRLGVSYPEIYKMQVHAILCAASQIQNTVPEIMVPFVMNDKDFQFIKNIIEEVAIDYSVKYLIGHMIELPSAALNSGKIAAHSSFFSFGTNDLTQMTLGLSRDDSSPIINPYREYAILDVDPFVSLQEGDVGELMQIAVDRGRAANKDLKIGICGEHGGDPQAVSFCVKLGLDYISCSPYRLSIARLAATQKYLQLHINKE